MHIQAEGKQDPRTASTTSSANLAWFKLNKYYTKLDDSHAYTSAIFLHPMYRESYFNTNWADKEDWQKKAKKGLNTAWQEFKRICAPEVLPGQDSQPKFIDSQGAFDELDDYLQNRRLRVPDDDDIIDWWRSMSSTYPALSEWALTLHSVPPMSAAAERVFSSANQTITPIRNRLTIQTVEALECLRSWRRADVEVQALREQKQRRRQERVQKERQIALENAELSSLYSSEAITLSQEKNHVPATTAARSKRRARGTASQPELLD